ncbi:hypothetical protein IRP63_14455 (plasmid) [Clostridium botulinum]|uniref:Uncharacterized protein n=2 Tax=Clostridium botulinum TaxID=1491 RepID=A0A0A0HVX7_CLOBO|nr:hypothetical protein Z955_15125 [Clostridium botulinum C/D str. DC5]KOC56820.1 hypothetical protein ADU89_01025 [Clostridium botulinum]MCD3232514.1 hypothetical protein [Clostridium botulinum D/C]KOC57295.1 hypothetical protein ADU90_05565 [Clostridium botulinum]MCD3238557.1 hypothetical protein [Clostridium botulinum D/C]
MVITMQYKLVYICFSKNQKHYLKSKGHKFLFKGLHPINHKAFWVFVNDFVLEQDLKERKRNNPRFNNDNKLK